MEPLSSPILPFPSNEFSSKFLSNFHKIYHFQDNNKEFASPRSRCRMFRRSSTRGRRIKEKKMQMRGAGNPRIGGFPRSWVAPAVQHPSSPSLPPSLSRWISPDVYIAREKRRGAHYVSVIGRIQPCFQFAQRRRLCRPKTALLRGPSLSLFRGLPFRAKTATGEIYIVVR